MMLQTVLFDLDNTLYSPSSDLFSLIDVRINRYMAEVAGIDPAEVDGLRRKYWALYGVTLQGLIRHHDVDPEDYLEYVHAVDVRCRVGPEPKLRQSLEGLSLRKAVFTNGSRGHAERVLAALGIEGLFEEIFDVRVAAYLPKPQPDPYHAVLRRLECDGHSCVMVEDSLDNLRTAKELGMRTVWVSDEGEAEVPDYVDARLPEAAAVAELVRGWCA